MIIYCFYPKCFVISHENCINDYYSPPNYFLKNVDADAAKQLMAYLVKLQSSLTEVNEYVFCYDKTFSILNAVIKFHVLHLSYHL